MSQATVTGKVMGAIAMTAKVFPNIKGFTFDTDRALLKVLDQYGMTTDVDISAATTVTCTISAGSYTLTVS